jgi:uncharacterized membrane protein YfcA
LDPESTTLLVLAGVASGLAGSIAGLASLFSYPALLAVGLPPIAANVTNTVALFSTTVGTAAGSRAELRGQRARLVKLVALAALGGSLGATLLLAFGAAAGVLMLSVLSLSATEPLPVTNAVKNIATGAANFTAAIAYAFLAPVNWGAAGVLACGCLIGSWTGPAVVRRLPETPLRIVIAAAGLGLAFALWRDAAGH